MKRLVSLIDFKLNIVFEYDDAIQYTSVAASDDSKVQTKMEMFQDFIVFVGDTLVNHGFEIVEESWSNRKGSRSYYFHFYPSDTNNNVLVEFMIIFRVADHFLSDGMQRSQNYRHQLAQKHKNSEDKYQKIRFKQILVGDRRFQSYADAKKEIERICNELELGDYSSF